MGLGTYVPPSCGNQRLDHTTAFVLGEGPRKALRYSVFLEPVEEAGFEGHYYAHIPALDLTTHGLGVEGALAAARELARMWVAEKHSHGEALPVENAALIGHIDVPDAVLAP